jgi:hypothetical protein
MYQLAYCLDNNIRVTLAHDDFAWVGKGSQENLSELNAASPWGWFVW